MAKGFHLSTPPAQGGPASPNSPTASQDRHLDIPIFARLYDFYKDFYQALLNFPKRDRYTLGQKIDNLTLNLFTTTITAGSRHGPEKLPPLEEASTKLDLLKILLRLAKDIKALDNKKYLQFQQRLQEIGKMLGGWIRSIKNES
jgi:hypothetical protein